MRISVLFTKLSTGNSAAPGGSAAKQGVEEKHSCARTALHQNGRSEASGLEAPTPRGSPETLLLRAAGQDLLPLQHHRRALPQQRAQSKVGHGEPAVV